MASALAFPRPQRSAEEAMSSIPALLEQSRAADVRALRAVNVPEGEIAGLVGGEPVG